MPVNSVVDKFVKKVFGTSSDVFLKKVKATVGEINNLEPSIQKLSDEELKAKTDEFKQKIAAALDGIEDKAERRKREQEILAEILPETFAVSRFRRIRRVKRWRNKFTF